MEDRRDTISLLKFIGRVKEGEKIDVLNMCIQPDNFFTSLSRTVIIQDSRSNTAIFVTTTVQKSFDILCGCLVSQKLSERTLSIKLIEDIEKAIIGIKSLKVTYRSDIMFCCRMDTLIEHIVTTLLDIKNVYGLVSYEEKVEVEA
jgi:hypothetical protein